MRKSMNALLASTMTIVGLAAGVTPAHAATNTAPPRFPGLGFEFTGFVGHSLLLEPGSTCRTVNIPNQDYTKYVPAVSAENRTSRDTLTFYNSYLPIIGCYDEVAVLGPGQKDSGVGTELGEKGGYYYTFTDITAPGRA